MSKKFRIEVVNFEKCIKNKMDIADDTIGYAIETLFETSESIYLWWNGCPIPLSVKYDVSEIWNDIIWMIKKVQQGSPKEFTIHWPSATFFATWEFKVDNHLLQIKPYWSTLNLEKKVLLKLRADEIS